MKHTAMPPRRTPLDRGAAQLRRTEFRRSGVSRAEGEAAKPAPGRRIRQVSPKRAADLRAYSLLRKAFLLARPWCEFPLGCGLPATEIQHRKGRRGWRLLAVEWWAASCHDHNAWAEDHTGEALACGWLLRIEDAA